MVSAAPQWYPSSSAATQSSHQPRCPLVAGTLRGSCSPGTDRRGALPETFPKWQTSPYCLPGEQIRDLHPAPPDTPPGNHDRAEQSRSDPTHVCLLADHLLLESPAAES